MCGSLISLCRRIAVLQKFIGYGVQKVLFAHKQLLVLDIGHVNHVVRGTLAKYSVVFPCHLWVNQIPKVVLILID